MSWHDANGYEAWRAARSRNTSVVIRLPFPPTANHLYATAPRRSRETGEIVQRRYKSMEAKNYAEAVYYHVIGARAHVGFTGSVIVLVCATAPDDRRRDVANLEKAVTDSLVDAGVMMDDRQVRDMRLVWAYSMYEINPDVIPAGGSVEVSVREAGIDELCWRPSEKSSKRKP